MKTRPRVVLVLSSVSGKDWSAVRIYVGNLPFATTDEDLRSMFEEFGTIASANIITDRDTGRSRGFGFVDMEDGAGRKAIEALNNKDMGGRALVVNEAKPREDRGGGGGRGRY